METKCAVGELKREWKQVERGEPHEIRCRVVGHAPQHTILKCFYFIFVVVLSW